MPEEKKYKKIIPHNQRDGIFKDHPYVQKARKSLVEHYKVPEPYATNILWWAFEAGWLSRLQETNEPIKKDQS